MKTKEENNTLKIKLEEDDKLLGDLSKQDIEELLLGRGYSSLTITEEQVAKLNSMEEVKIPLQTAGTDEEVKTAAGTTVSNSKPFDGKGIYGENISSRFEFLNRGSELVWEVLGDYLDRGFLMSTLVVARGWTSYRADFSFRRGQAFRDCYKVRGEEITLLRQIIEDSYPDKTGCDGRRVLSKSIQKLDDGAIGIKLLVFEDKGPIELKIVMDKIY